MRLCPLFSGSSGNAVLVEGGGVRVLVDAGLPGSTVCAALRAQHIDPATLTAILVTHEHSDHIQGVGVLSRKLSLPVYANSGTWEAMRGSIGAIAPRLERTFETGRDFTVGRLNVTPVKTPHDAAESVGYSFHAGGRHITVMTDIGYVTNDLFSAAEGSDLLLIESNHDIEMLNAGPYPFPLKRRILGPNGHLSNDDCGDALVRLHKSGVTQAILGHLSRDNNYEALALLTVRSHIDEADIPAEEFSLTVAPRDRSAGVFTAEDAV